MQGRFNQVVLLLGVLVFGAYVAEPYLERTLLAPPVPRLVEPRGTLSEAERSTVALFRRVAPSVVQVVGSAGADTMSTDEREGTGQVKSGTGFFWDTAGHVVTNNHVVENTDALAVRLASGELVRARLLGATPAYDLAVLRIEGNHALPPPLAIGRSADLEVGQSAFAIGNPFGLDQSLTTGVISALKRRLPTSGGREIPDAIQTDAAINPGNSGGPLLDSAGRLIGVNTAIYSPSGANAGIGFAIPVDVVNRVVPELIRNGRVPTPGIGIVAADEASTARLGIEGVIVVSTRPGSAAERAGLRGVDLSTGAIGDVIVAAGDRPVRRLNDLTAALEAAGIGHEVGLTVRRGGREVPVRAQVGDVGGS